MLKANRLVVRSLNRRRGIACVEFALLLPILLTMVLGILEMGRYVEVRQILTQAAREGARQASAGQITNTQVASVVTGCVKAAGLPTTDLTITVQDLTNPGTDVSQATTLDNLQVTVSLPFIDTRWCSSVLWTDNTSKVTATVNWISALPQSYPANVTAPTGN